MICPECQEDLGSVWVQKPGKNAIYSLPDAGYCFNCLRMYVATPQPMVIQSLQPKASEK